MPQSGKLQGESQSDVPVFGEARSCGFDEECTDEGDKSQVYELGQVINKYIVFDCFKDKDRVFQVGKAEPQGGNEKQLHHTALLSGRKK